MIELIIEKKFLEDFTKSFKSENKYHKDFTNFLQYTATPLTLYTNIEIEDISKCQLNGIPNPFIELLANSKEFKTVNYSRFEMLSKEFLLSKNVIKMFFIDSSAQDCNELRKKYGFEFICIENFEKVWEFYYSNERERFHRFNITDNPKIESRFDNWEKLNEFNHAIITVIISDPYILNDKDKIDNNIIAILNTFIKNTATEQAIEFIIFTTDDPKKTLPNEAWETRFNLLVAAISSRENINIVLYRYPNSVPDHARGIFSNYWYIKPGNSLNFFDKNGKMTKVKDDIEFNFIFYKSTVAILKERIFDLFDFIKSSINDTKGLGAQEAKKRVFSKLEIDSNYEFKLMTTLKNFIS